MHGAQKCLTYCDKLSVVVQRVRGVLLDGCNVQGRAEGDDKEERQSSGDLACHDAPVDSIKLQVMNVVQAIDLPEGARGVRALQQP